MNNVKNKLEIIKLKRENQILKSEIEFIKSRKFFKLTTLIDKIRTKVFHYKKRFIDKIINPINSFIPDIKIQKKVGKYFKNHQNQIKIIALPTIDWKMKLYQRPQHLAIHLSRLNNFYVYGTYNHQDDHVYGFSNINKNLVITNKYNYFLDNKTNSYVFLLSTQQTTSIKRLKKIIRNKKKIIYDYIDEIHADIIGNNKANQFLLNRHKYIMENKCAELVLCVSKKLYQEVLKYYPKDKVLLSPNGVDYQHFQVKKKNINLPEEMSILVKSKKPIIGYYGAIAPWLDYKLINQTAKNNPNWQFIFIGLNYGDGLKNLNQNLPNIHFFGAKDYEELPKYGIWFDIAIIPFQKGNIAKATSPLKIYEYMAMGKPTIVTEDLLECYRLDGVLISKNTITDFTNKIKIALKEIKSLSLTKKIKKQAQECTWQKRAEDINKRLTP